MKPISEAIKKIRNEQLKDLSKQLSLKKSSPATIKSALLNPLGIDAVLSNLDTNELKVLKTVYEHKDGINFGELEKELKIGVQNIERITAMLSQKLLMYTIKNRQLLNNKLDKAYGIDEISPLIHITGVQSVKDHVKKLSVYTHRQAQVSKTERGPSDEKSKKFLHFITKNGGLISLSEAKDYIGDKSIIALLTLLQKQGHIHIYQVIEPLYNTFIVIAEYSFHGLLREHKNFSTRKEPDVQNGYTVVLNMLCAFDTISTYGLFLTKQHEFRKIDKRRIVDSMIKIKTGGQEYLPMEKTGDLSLFLLNRLQSLKLTRDIVNITLKNLKKELENPKKIIRRIIKSLDSTADNEELFPSPIVLPDSATLINILKVVSELQGGAVQILTADALSMLISQSRKKTLDESIKHRNRCMESIADSLKLLAILGLVDIQKDHYFLSDIGIEIVNQLLKTSPAQIPFKNRKSIYINPDFTIIIPTHDIPSLTTYHLLTHSDIVKQDVLLHAHISKASIVKAQKRGMTLKLFLEALENHAKNDVPQNLKFLLNEWSAQTIKMEISRCIILKSSHSTFIDEISMGKLKDAIIEKISQNHVIISKKYIDDIVKMAQKKDAVIKLFMDPDEEED